MKNKQVAELSAPKSNNARRHNRSHGRSTHNPNVALSHPKFRDVLDSEGNVTGKIVKLTPKNGQQPILTRKWDSKRGHRWVTKSSF